MIGFAIVLALLAVLSVLSYRGFIKVSDGFGAFNQRVKVVGIVRDVDRGFVAFRRFVREFALSGDEKLIAEARKQQEVLAKSVKQGLDEIKNPERRARMTEISEQFEKYAKRFRQARRAEAGAEQTDHRRSRSAWCQVARHDRGVAERGGEGGQLEQHDPGRRSSQAVAAGAVERQQTARSP